MKIKYILGLFLLSTGMAIGQQAPTGTPVPNGNYTTAQQAASAWYRGGNIQGNQAQDFNLFGTAWNSPIYFITGGSSASSYRMKLNGDFFALTQYPIDGYTSWGNSNTTSNTSGYLLLGPDAPFQTQLNQTIYKNRGAYSLLHLNGTAPIQQNGYRPWMKTGVTFTDNQDMSYFGLRQIGTALDYTETVLNWSDNTNGLDDDMCFRFTGASTSSTTIDQANLRSTTDLDGLHIARFSSNGRFGLGNTFGHTNAPGHPTNFYVSPQSLLHMSYDHQVGTANQPYGFMQITYRRTSNPPELGVGEKATDGLRFGIDNQVFNYGNKQFLNSYLRWQELSSFIIQTEDGDVPNIAQNERLRITSIGALDSNYTTWAYDGLKAPTNVTRISISESGANPLLRPKSLLHLGYDYGGLFTVQGYRKWMDMGVLTSNNKDHVWLGLKPRDSLTIAVDAINDRLDAVVAWGTDREATSPAAVDNMRFIFTGHLFDANPEHAPSTSYNGLEMMRLYPGNYYSHKVYSASGTVADSVLTYGRVGIGDFTTLGVNGEPTHKLDVVGNARLRYLPDSTYFADSTVQKIVMVDNNGVLRWKTFLPAGFGAACSDTVNGKLQFDTQVDLYDHNLYFTRNNVIGTNKMGLGYDCGTNMEAKLNVFSKNETWSGSFYVDGNSPVDLSGNSHQGGVKSIIDSTRTVNATALYGYVAPNNYITMGSQIGVKGEVDARSAKEAIAVFGDASVLASNSGAIGGRFLTSGSAVGRAVQAQNNTVQAAGAYSGFGFGGDFNSITTLGHTVNSNTGVGGSATGNATVNIGVRGLASGNGTTNIGVYGEAFSGGSTWAGYFEGNVYVSGSFGPSDQNLKENVLSMEHADSLIKLLNPVTFDFKVNDYPQLHLQSGNQLGLIAQQVETVFPNIVKQTISPAQYDSIGNLVHPSVTFKTVDYTKLIPVLISGHQEQAKELQTKDSIINVQQNQIDDLNNRLTQLENCLSGILPYLCQLSQSAVQANTPAAQEEVRKNLSVTLSNRNAIVLDQNVPNPFAEQTVINFSIPETVKKAQIHFYDANGRFMNSIEVTDRGLGSITVFGSDLSSGVYTYTLVADGQVVATKKMMKE